MKSLWYRLRRTLNQVALHAVRDRKDISALHVLAPLSRTYLPMTQVAMRPSAILAVLNDIAINGRRHVVELGGGISTFYIGYLLRDKGGHLWTVEHDEHWVRLLESELKAAGLDDVVTVIHAPLARSSHQWPGEETMWYAEEPLREVACTHGGIDLLLVDGPPAHQAGRTHSRYPAVPFFASALGDDYIVVLDDIDRRGEQEVLRRWEQQLGIRFQRRLIHGTIAVGCSGSRIVQ